MVDVYDLRHDDVPPPTLKHLNLYLINQYVLWLW